MGLSLKDVETESRVRKLAERRGLGLTAAIRLAVDNELARDDIAEAEDRKLRLAGIQSIQDRIAARGGLPTMAELDAEMYDDDGLPR